MQAFQVDRDADEVLDAAERYLEGAGSVAASLRGRIERQGDALVIQHGRVRTRIGATPRDGGTHVVVSRHGRAPLEDTRVLLFGVGIAGFVLAWALAWYNEKAAEGLSPLVTIALFFTGLLGAVVGLYIVDRSLERRSRSLMESLEDAMRGDPYVVLEREVAGLDRTAAVADGLLFYCVSLVVEFIIFVILLSEGVRGAIDQAVTLEVMRWGFGLPVLPAALFGAVYYVGTRRAHEARLRRLPQRDPAGLPV